MKFGSQQDVLYLNTVGFIGSTLLFIVFLHATKKTRFLLTADQQGEEKETKAKVKNEKDEDKEEEKEQSKSDAVRYEISMRLVSSCHAVMISYAGWKVLFEREGWGGGGGDLSSPASLLACLLEKDMIYGTSKSGNLEFFGCISVGYFLYDILAMFIVSVKKTIQINKFKNKDKGREKGHGGLYGEECQKDSQRKTLQFLLGRFVHSKGSIIAHHFGLIVIFIFVIPSIDYAQFLV
eukprot:Nk52_evm71s158 gene=Nk52_evmTU71s158